jgi:protein TonB
MSARADILDERDPMKRSFASSLALHGAVVVILVGGNLLSPKPAPWGDPNGGGGLGSVEVNPVATIPLPAKSGPTNPLANDSQFQVPEPPSKPKPQTKAKPPDPNAVKLNAREEMKRLMREESSRPNKLRDQQQYPTNQAYYSGGQQLNSPMYSMPGSGQVGTGTSSPFGTQLGWYANSLREAVARKWNTADVDSRLSTAPPVIVGFTLHRDGSVSSIRIKQSSGNRALDYSAQRAVEDAAPLQPIPREFPRDQAEIEFQFLLRR